MQVSVLEWVDGDQAEQAWHLYLEAFEQLAVRAAARHLMHREEFDETMQDKRVLKVVVHDTREPDRLIGVATMTNRFESISWVSPGFFAERYPQEFAESRIWYVGILAIHPDYQGTGAVSHLIGGLFAQVQQRGGIVGLDTCRLNEEAIRLPQAVLRLVRTINAEVSMQRVDVQSYWAYTVPELPATAVGRRAG